MMSKVSHPEILRQLLRKAFMGLWYLARNPRFPDGSSDPPAVAVRGLLFAARAQERAPSPLEELRRQLNHPPRVPEHLDVSMPEMSSKNQPQLVYREERSLQPSRLSALKRSGPSGTPRLGPEEGLGRAG